MAGPIVRPAGVDDVAALAALRRAWTEEQRGEVGTDDDHEARVRDWLVREASQRLMWLAESDGRAVGLVTAVVIDRMPRPGPDGDATWGYLQHCYVVAEHRSQGIGRALVDTVLATAETHGWTHVLLHTTPGARSLYEGAGFAPADEWLVRRGSP